MMRAILLTPIVLAILTTSVQAAGSNWTPVATGRKGEVWMVDLNSIKFTKDKSNNKLRKASIMSEIPKPSFGYYFGAKKVVRIGNFDCLNNLYSADRLTTYLENGKVDSDQAENPEVFFDFKPNTTFAAAAKVVCAARLG